MVPLCSLKIRTITGSDVDEDSAKRLGRERERKARQKNSNIDRETKFQEFIGGAYSEPEPELTRSLKLKARFYSSSY